MVRIHKPRSGSLAFYPRKRAARQRPRVNLIKVESKEAKPINFIGYKVGMLHILATNARKGSVLFGQEVSIPLTVIECPPVKVFGVRAYEKITGGKKVVLELTSEPNKYLQKKIRSFKKTKTKEQTKIDGLDKIKDKICEIRLVCHTQPYKTGIGKKKPDIYEVGISGPIEKQIEYAKEKLGKEISVTEIFKENEFVDVTAVTKGKGFQGVIKRFGVKIQPRKAKTRRTVGSIGPWHPPLIMWTVPRPGQMGYHTRTEYNKKIIKIEKDFSKINPASGFTNYGLVKNECLLLVGSIPGSVKRPISLRVTSRKPKKDKFIISEIKYISTQAESKKKVKRESSIIEDKGEEKAKAHKIEKKE
ncbi:MAG: 50S ribosomal protein L3 [Candidatus Diapherotrites archaeon]|nr:50S ribosomal protein L3 [Candidatus Diapherotrites archaeon]